MSENCLIEPAQHKGTFYCWDHGYSTDSLREIFQHGVDHARVDFLMGKPQVCPNILMASRKVDMANAVYPLIDRLVITNQTETPSDIETVYTGAIYTTKPTEEFTRSGNVNPYTVGWNILSDSANGAWGSFILIDKDGAMINRALSGISKTAGTAKLIIFTGSVTS